MAKTTFARLALLVSLNLSSLICDLKLIKFKYIVDTNKDHFICKYQQCPAQKRRNTASIILSKFTKFLKHKQTELNVKRAIYGASRGSVVAKCGWNIYYAFVLFWKYFPSTLLSPMGIIRFTIFVCIGSTKCAISSSLFAWHYILFIFIKFFFILS